jgi:hypothetical protein
LDYPTAEQIKSRPDWDRAKRLITKWDMHEFSVCNVPANSDCVALAVSKGIKLLGEPKPSCWSWADAPTLVMPKPVPIVEEKQGPKIELPPKFFARRIKSLEAELIKKLEKRITQDEILERLRGRA